MATLRELLWRVAARFRRPTLEKQTEAEMRFHLEMEAEAGVRRGLTREQAEREARLRAGSVTASMEDVRDQRGLGWLDGTLLDLRQASSALRRQPGFLLIAGGTLASAVAINTLIFTVVDGVILRPLPYPAPERLVRVYEASPRYPKFPLSIFNYRKDKRENRTLESIALYVGEDVQLMHNERAEHLSAVKITADFLPTLGVTPALGRNFLPSEMHDGVRVTILSYGLWKNRFQADPQIVGKTIRLERETWTVVGVLPVGFQHVGGEYRSPLQGDTVALWRPLSLDLKEDQQRAWHFTNAIARLKPGVTTAAATEDLNRILDDLKRRYPDAYGRARARVEPLAAEVVGHSRSTVMIITAAGALVLLLALVNIAGLCIARVLARRRELAIRQALGGGAWRLIRAVLSENVIVGLVGAVAGLCLTAALLPLLRAILPADFPRLQEIGFSWAAAGFALAAALLTSATAGLLPALRQTGVDPREGLSEDSRTSSGGHRVRNLRAGLVAGEVALSSILCFSAVLLMRSSVSLDGRDHGFDRGGVLTLQVVLPQAAYGKVEQIRAFQSEIVSRWQQIPGVRSAGFGSNLPWSGWDENTGFGIVGRAAVPGESTNSRFQSADNGYFRALRFRLLRGRFPEQSDTATAPSVVVVNDTFARRYFPDTEALGQTLDIWDQKCRIVGVVADVRDRPADATAEPAFWWPAAQMPFSQFRAVLRTDGDPLSLVSAMRQAVDSLDRELPLAEVRTMDDVATRALAERRFALWLCEAFAALAMALAAIGIYGLLTYFVRQRRREIGLRLALGATRPSVLWMIVANGMVLAAAGIVIGLAMAPVAGRAVSSLLYGVGTVDVLSLLLAPAIIVVVTFIGCVAPGWVASRTEPMSALREQ